MRDMLFLSHANPEDNEFTRWAALQLAGLGYPVWCDLTKLLGGEDFWSDIEDAIRARSSKFLFVLSHSSNSKLGALKELQIAENVMRDENLARFIIPLAIDDLPPRQFNIQLARLQAVLFRPSWADGLAQLIKRLEDDHVSKDARFTPSTVAGWWREHFNASRGIRPEPEQLVSNFFPLNTTPSLFFHRLNVDPREGLEAGASGALAARPCPVVLHGNLLISFAPPSALAGSLAPGVAIRKTTAIPLSKGQELRRRRFWSWEAESRGLTELLGQAWDGLIAARNLPTYSFAKGGPAFYFRDGALSDNRVNFKSLADASPRYRQVVGFKTRPKRNPDDPPRLRYWHFALEARPTITPAPGYLMKTHLLFSDDGQSLWQSKDRMHRAGPSQRRNWWNDDWRDRLIGTMAWLAKGEDQIAIPAGGGAMLPLNATPSQFACPVSFEEVELVDAPLEAEFDDDEIDQADSTLAIEADEDQA